MQPLAFPLLPAPLIMYYCSISFLWSHIILHYEQLPPTPVHFNPVNGDSVYDQISVANPIDGPNCMENPVPGINCTAMPLLRLESVSTNHIIGATTVVIQGSNINNYNSTLQHTDTEQNPYLNSPPDPNPIYPDSDLAGDDLHDPGQGSSEQSQIKPSEKKWPTDEIVSLIKHHKLVKWHLSIKKQIARNGICF